ncbi:MAG: SDR family oxidoreductase [Sinobacteraceae bacterium]|nr:SDR family oxidoreductase [Nevskiaceae bacterium]
MNAPLPGYTLTERLVEVGAHEVEMSARIPPDAWAARELAAREAFLASEKAGYVTGQAIACDGGLL